MRRLEHAAHGIGVRELGEEKGHEGQRGEGAADDEGDAVDRRAELRLGREHPVDRREGQRQDDHDQPRGCPLAARKLGVGRAVFVELERQHTNPPRPEVPEREVERREEQKALPVQPIEFLAHVLVGHGPGRVGPRIDLLQPEEDGDEEEHHPEHRARGGAERAADHQSPLAAGDVLQHQHRQRAGHDREPEEEARQVGLEERPRIDDVADDAQHDADDADDQRRHPPAVDAGGAGRRAGGRANVGRHGAPPDNCARCAGGRSLMVPLRLNCSARM